MKATKKITTPKPDPKAWGRTFTILRKAKKVTLGQIAERLGRAESTVRSWTNGTREINLIDFLMLCSVSDISPQSVLFSGEQDGSLAVVLNAWANISDQGREHILVASEGALKRYGKRKP